MSLFWKFFNYAKKKYINTEYKDKLPEVTYDNALHGYMHPYYDHEEFSIELLAEKLCCVNLCYEFQVGGAYDYRSEFGQVIKIAYNYGSQFTIPPECESDYSKQELALLRKLAYQGEMDRQKYRVEHGLPCITMTTEDYSEEDEVVNSTNCDNNNVDDYSWHSF